MNTNVKQMVTGAFLLVLGIILPFFTMQIPEIGNMLLPMHLPVILCGFLLNWKYGLLIGFLTPMLRSLLFGMPPMFPTAFAMSFELATYGISIALLHQYQKHSIKEIYITLISSMFIGRIVWGLVMMTIMNVSQGTFSFAIFFTSAFLNAVPGILLQLFLVPILIQSLKKIGFTS